MSEVIPMTSRPWPATLAECQCGEFDVIHLATATFKHLGEPDYVAQLSRALGHMVPLAHLGILTFAKTSRPSLIGTTSLVNPALAADVAHLYLKDHYRSDSLDEVRAHRDGDIMLAQRQRAQEISNPAYRACCYEQPGIIDRVSFFQQFDAEHWIAVHVYRDVSQRYFNDQDLKRLMRIAPLLTHGADKHRRLVSLPKPAILAGRERGAIEVRLAAKNAQLSRREFEVCLRILEGRTAKQIARELGIAPTSVVSHRHNAYRKLDIHDHRQLFALVFP